MSEIGGGTFESSFASGVISSLISSGIGALGPKGAGYVNSGTTKALMIVGGGLSGGISSSIAGGNFWQGVQQGLITAGLNHAGHYIGDVGTNTRIIEGIDTHGDLAWGGNQFEFTINYDGNIKSLIHEVIHVDQAILSPWLFADFEAYKYVGFSSYSIEVDAFRVSYSLGEDLGVNTIKGITNEFLKKNGY